MRGLEFIVHDNHTEIVRIPIPIDGLRLTSEELRWYTGAAITIDSLSVAPTDERCVLSLQARGAPDFHSDGGSPGLLRVGEHFFLGRFRFCLFNTAPTPSVTHGAPAGPDATTEVWVSSGAERHRLQGADIVTVGKSPTCTITLGDPCVSHQHCRLRIVDGEVWVEDLGSTNGVWVNGLRVFEQRLPVPCAVEVGRSQLRVESRAPATRGMVGNGPAMLEVFDRIHRFADVPEPILVLGPSGTGKELVARALHKQSGRRDAPFVAINCSALSENLVESELFGYVKGAFTGANEDTKGAFESAHQGTLFFDEIGELPLSMQPKLLRALETRAVRRVGGVDELPVDTRVVAATHRDLSVMVAKGSFRRDLYHRLFVIQIVLPPLSERPEDIMPLAEHFLQQHRGRPVSLDRSAQDALLRYHWPGNVRELKNVLVRSMLMGDGRVLSRSDLYFGHDANVFAREAPVRDHDHMVRLDMMAALRETRGNRAKAARILGISKSTFHDRVRRLGIPQGYGRPATA